MEAPQRSTTAASPPGPPLAHVPEGVEVRGPSVASGEAVLSFEALAFVAKLERRFGPRRRALLAAPPARSRRSSTSAGNRNSFRTPPRSAPADWTVAPIPDDLRDRRVEITGPVDRKMIINALNSGATVFMADFEDSSSPTWKNLVEGQLNLLDAVDGTIEHVSPEGKVYRLARARRRSWCGRAAGTSGEARPRRRGAGVGEPLRLRPLLLPQRPAAARPRHGALLLPAEDGEPPRGAALERRLPRGAGGAGRPARDDPRDGADRDDPRGLRDGRDPLGAARALRRPELRALGLHLQLHQEVPEPPRLRAARPLARHDDPPFLRATRTSSSAPATGAASTRWAAWPRRSRSRTTRPGTAAPWRRSPRTSGARSRPATTGPGSRIRGWSRWRARSSTPACPTRTRSDGRSRPKRSRPTTCSRCPRARSPRRACART